MRIETVPTNNISSRHGKDIIGIIFHFTAGGDMDGTIKWFLHPKSRSSSHYVISRNGRIVRMVDEKMAAWHAGSSSTKPKLNGISKLNARTIGIELCNWGWLYESQSNQEVKYNNETYYRKHKQLYTRMRNWTMPFLGEYERHTITSNILTGTKFPFPGGNVCNFWESFPEEQLQATKKLILDIVERHPHITREWIVRHEDVDPTRKLDTGPAFRLEEILDSIFQPARITASTYVSQQTEKEMMEVYEPRVDKNIWGCIR